MEAIDVVQLENAMRELHISITEARNLIYSGKAIQCDRKLQGSLKKCDNVLIYIQEIRESQNNAVANKSNKESN